VPAGGTVLEIGSWKGKSTYCLARGLKDGTVLAIDPFDASGEEGSAEIYAAEAGDSPLLNQFDARMSGLGVRERIRVLQGYSRDFVGKVPSLDLLFIDGDHSIEGCLFDYASFAGALVSGGYLLFHDYYPERPELGPTWVINGQVATSDSFIVEEVVDSLWIGKKR
jgi:predicted O-methyltransferase YrrM